MAFFYIILYFTEIDTKPIYSYRSILGRISWDGPLIPKHLVMLILFKIFETSSIGMGYILLKIVTLLGIILYVVTWSSHDAAALA